MIQADLYRYCGRSFSQPELQLIRRLIAENPDWSRFQISKNVCQTLQWLKPDGGLKDMSCRVALLRMQANGLIQLPPPRNCGRGGRPCRISFSELTLPESPLTLPVHQLPPLRLSPVESRKKSQLWNEYIHRYHYLGFTPLPGAQIRYFVYSSDRLLALLGFSAAAWKTAPRDQFIGWSPQQRQRNLHLVVNNARFLILPWITSKNLASKILASAAHCLPADWMKRYKYTPVLLESFVQSDRFAGTCYKASNWIKVGTTQGRGKLDTHNLCKLAKKDVWLYPLSRFFKDRLLA